MNVQLIKKIQKLKKERNKINAIDVSSNDELYKKLQSLENEISQLESLTSVDTINSDEFVSNDKEIILG